MIKLDSYTDENVTVSCKKYIEDNLKTGDVLTTQRIQILFKIGYNKTNRIIKKLIEENVLEMKIVGKSKFPEVV